MVAASRASPDCCSSLQQRARNNCKRVPEPGGLRPAGTGQGCDARPLRGRSQFDWHRWEELGATGWLTSERRTYWFYTHTHIKALYCIQHYTGFMWSTFKHTPDLGLDVAKEKQVLLVFISLIHAFTSVCSWSCPLWMLSSSNGTHHWHLLAPGRTKLAKEEIQMKQKGAYFKDLLTLKMV